MENVRYCTLIIHLDRITASRYIVSSDIVACNGKLSSNTLWKPGNEKLTICGEKIMPTNGHIEICMVEFHDFQFQVNAHKFAKSQITQRAKAEIIPT